MPAASEPPTAGQHRLGAHVIGQRVVVRRLLPGETGPSGGPAMTDLLGVCLRWESGECVLLVTDRDGVEHTETIPWALIVSGKPVPARPDRHRRVPPRDAQVHAFALFPDLVTTPLGSWVLRDSATATARRAHSVLAFGPSGLQGPGEDPALAAVTAHYDRPIAAVLSGSAEQSLLQHGGWVPESGEADTDFLVAGTARVTRAVRRVPAAAAHRDDVSLEEPAPGRWARVRIGTTATGYAGLDGDWVGIGGLEVDPAHRRRGLGLAVVGALVEWGAQHGATTAYLQVLGDNTAALALYEGLGFTHHHSYAYLTPGSPPS